MKRLTHLCGVLTTLLLAESCLISYPMAAQTIFIDSTFTSDCEIFPFQPDDTIYGLSISGSVNLNSDTSLVRVILTDDADHEWMVYEAYKQIVHDSAFAFSSDCDESCYMNGLVPQSIRIYLTAAQITIESLTIDTLFHEDLPELIETSINSMVQRKISALNDFINENKMIWFAGETPLSKWSYERKKRTFGEKYLLYGLDYYAGGIFDPLPNYTSVMDNSNLVNEFDWRHRHGANDHNSPYWDQNPDYYFEECEGESNEYHESGNGWMTSVKNQDIYSNFTECEANCKGTCYIFGSFGAIEAVANLSYNKALDLDLSEQHALSCRPGFDCDGDWPHRVYIWVMSHGVVSDSDYPWLDFDYPCSEPSNPDYQISITDYEDDYNLNNPDEIKQAIILKGPVTATIHYLGATFDFSHAMALIGYGIIEEDDTIYGLNGQYITINDPGYAQHIGKLFWKFKQSFSPFYGANGGYIYHLHKQWPQSEFFTEIVSTVTPLILLDGSIDQTIECHDYDDDGYNNWGITESAPVTCIQTCSDLADSDDNNPRVAQFDNQYNGTPIMPAINVYIPISNIEIEPGEIFSFAGDPQNDIILNFHVENPGNAKLHLVNTLQGTGKITLLNQNFPDNYTIHQYPASSICFNDIGTSFSIKLAAQSQSGSLVTVQINLFEPGMEDFEFTLIYNGCETQEGYYEIEGQVTWSDPFKTQLKDVHILQNAVLTVEGTVILSSEVDIVVETGGQLVLDGGKLTGACMWNGIDLDGNLRLPQTADVQGTVRIINGGTIEFARCGIENAIFNGSEYIYSGGIINADGAEFKDNIVGIRFWPYHNFNPGTGEPIYNFSRVKNSDFVTTHDLYELGHNPAYFIEMLEVEGIYVLACNFHNEVKSHELELGEEPGIGIYSNEADYVVDHYCHEPQIPCPEYVPCTFENLKYGIKSSYITSSESVRIRNSDFINNQTGIYLGVSAFPEVVMNTFHVRKAEPVPFIETVYCGLYLDRCSGYQIEENVFYTYMEGAQREDYQAVGLVVNNSGPNNNEVYKNTFIGLYAGLIAQEVNRNEDGGQGLQIRCNIFENDIFDIAVTQSSRGKKGIAKNQGSEGNYATAPASNQFTLAEQDPEGNYYNVCENITYWHHANTTGFNLIPTRHTPEPAVDPNSGDYSEPFVADQSCPSHLSGGGIRIEEEKSAMFVSGQQADSVRNLLNLFIDGGNTEELLTEIQTSWPEDGYELYSELISESPYLSDTSLIEAVGKEDVLLPGMITDVLIANPQSSKSEDIMTAVDDRTDPLTDDQLADIGEGRFIVGAKEALEMDLTHNEYLKDISKYNLIRLFKADTLIDSPGDSIINITSIQPSLSDEYLKVFEYLKMDDSLNMVNSLNAIPGNYNLSTAELLEHSLYEDYFNLLLSLDTAGSKILSMDSVQIALCHNILNNASGSLEGIVRNLLVINDSLDYNEVILMPEPGLKSGKVRIWPIKSQFAENYMKIYPNPAKSVVIIETRLIEEPQDAFINIIDSQGIKLNSYPIQNKNDYLVIPLSEFQSGVLFCQLINRNMIIDSRKIVILK